MVCNVTPVEVSVATRLFARLTLVSLDICSTFERVKQQANGSERAGERQKSK